MRASSDPSGAVLLFVVLRQAVRRGVPLGEALRSTVGETGIPAEVLAGMAHHVESGDSLSEALERRPQWFPPPLPALVAAGERSERLDETLDRCVALLRRQERTRTNIAAALVYPALCLACLLAVIVLFAVVDPLGRVARLASDVSGALSSARGPVPLATRMPELSAALLLAVVVGFAAMYRRPVLRDRLRLDLPVSGPLHRLASAAAFTRALAVLLERGAAVDSAIAAAIPCTGNAWVEERLRRRLADVRDGEGLSRCLALPGVFPPSLTWRLAVGEARDTFPEALAEAAEAYEEELEVRSARVARLIEPASLILIGLMAALLMRYVIGSEIDSLSPWMWGM